MQHRLALAVAALATTGLLAGCGDDSTGADPSPTGTPTSTPTSPASLGKDVLLTDDDTVYSDGADWFRTEAFEGDGQDVFNPCTRESLEGTGATSVFRANFELRNSAAKAPEVNGDFLTQVVGEYADEAAATAAYDEITGWLAHCSPRPEGMEEYRSQPPREVKVDGATAQIVDSTYGPAPKEIDPTGDAAYIMETGLVRQGARLSVLTSVIVGQDYNFTEEDGGTPVNRMLPKVAARMTP
ncbi:hypothetical protein [Nocardioides sp. LML1-1-1.1]|uniref:hypothetical protein n=1 Tax=Nocardioides sp. LML1-1-1.1 TaxID=3135248 RepID=UPI00343C24FB